MKKLVVILDTIKVFGNDGLKHLMLEVMQVGEQLTDERKCLGSGDLPRYPETSKSQETSQDACGSPRNSRAKQIWKR